MHRLALVLALPLAACAGVEPDSMADPDGDPPTVDARAPDGATPADAAPGSDAHPAPDMGLNADAAPPPGPDADLPPDPDADPPPAPDAGGPDDEPAWDGEGPFPGACRLDITNGAADRRFRWNYDETLAIGLERIDEGIDGSFEVETAFAWADGPAHVPCVEHGPAPMRTPAADLALADPLPAEGGALRGTCGPYGLQTLSNERRLIWQQTRLLTGDAPRPITRRFTWDDRDRLTGVELSFGDALAPDFAPAGDHRVLDAEYDGQGRLTRLRHAASVVSVLDAEDSLGMIEWSRVYQGDTVRITETRDYEEGARNHTWTFADGRRSRVGTGDVARVISRDAAGRVIAVQTTREGRPTGYRTQTLTTDDQGRVTQVVESMGASAGAEVPVRRARLTWHDRGNLWRVDWATRRGGRWVDGEVWAFGYGCWFPE